MSNCLRLSFDSALVYSRAYSQPRPDLTFLASRPWRLNSVRPSPPRMNEQVRALWKLCRKAIRKEARRRERAGKKQ